MLWHCLWAALLPMAVLGQTYYINFVFNNNRYSLGQDSVQVSQEAHSQESENESDGKTMELNSKEHSNHNSYTKPHKPTTSTTSRPKLPNTLEESKQEDDCVNVPSNTDEECEEFEDDSVTQNKVIEIEHTTMLNEITATTARATTATARPTTATSASTKATTATATTTKATTTATTTSTTVTTTATTETTATTTATSTSTTAMTTATTTASITQNKQPIEQSTVQWLSPTPHPPEFFNFPQAKCHEELDLHEVFGIMLAKDRGLPSKVLCEFDNSWGGPWLLMNRMELPARIHMRHWFFGYITEDYKDMNINFLALAHIINNMRLAMLIIGQDNNNQLVYNLYDDFVMSGFNDLFMLRKAHLVEANTTDLMYISVGEVLVSDAGRNRSCPFRVLGAWWGPKWDEYDQGFCVFPVERDIHRPGYIAFFIKPSPFEVNNTAFYNTAITTRRPWASTIDPALMAKAKNDRQLYNSLKEEDFLSNKQKVRDELNHRANQYKSIEARRREEENGGLDVAILTTIDRSLDKT